VHYSMLPGLSSLPINQDSDKPFCSTNVQYFERYYV
jgi:hypothetical protein